MKVYPNVGADIGLVKQQVDMICSLALNIPTEDATALVNEIDRTLAFMPITDPTGFKQIMFTADAHMAIARAFLTFRAELSRIIATDQAQVTKRRAPVVPVADVEGSK